MVDPIFIQAKHKEHIFMCIVRVLSTDFTITAPFSSSGTYNNKRMEQIRRTKHTIHDTHTNTPPVGEYRNIIREEKVPPLLLSIYLIKF